AAMYSATGVRAPWYTSGSHMWNGTAPNLKAMPTIMKAAPNHSGIPFSSGSEVIAEAMSWNCRLPVTPYTHEIPYSRQPDAIEPSTKYFIADSAPLFDFLSNATSAYCESDSNSSPRYIVNRPFADIITIMPSRPKMPMT